MPDVLNDQSDIFLTLPSYLYNSLFIGRHYLVTLMSISVVQFYLSVKVMNTFIVHMLHLVNIISQWWCVSESYTPLSGKSGKMIVHS